MVTITTHRMSSAFPEYQIKRDNVIRYAYSQKRAQRDFEYFKAQDEYDARLEDHNQH